MSMSIRSQTTRGARRSNIDKHENETCGDGAASGKTNYQVETLEREQDTQNRHQQIRNHAEQSNREHVESKNGVGCTKEERRNMQSALYNLKGKAKEMAKRMGTL